MVLGENWVSACANLGKVDVLGFSKLCYKRILLASWGFCGGFGV